MPPLYNTYGAWILYSKFYKDKQNWTTVTKIFGPLTLVILTWNSIWDPFWRSLLTKKIHICSFANLKSHLAISFSQNWYLCCSWVNLRTLLVTFFNQNQKIYVCSSVNLESHLTIPFNQNWSMRSLLATSFKHIRNMRSLLATSFNQNKKTIFVTRSTWNLI